MNPDEVISLFNLLYPGMSGQKLAPTGNADLTNFNAANAQMNLTPQEQALYQRHLINLWGPGGVTNPDGSRSSLYAMSAGVDGSTYMLPTVYGGQILPPDQAMQRAQSIGLGAFPSYPSPQAADARYGQMHGFMDRDTGNYFRGRR